MSTTRIDAMVNAALERVRRAIGQRTRHAKEALRQRAALDSAHFANATAQDHAAANRALLDALGVPAHYVTGVAIELRPGQWPTVIITKLVEPLHVDAASGLAATLRRFTLTPTEPTP